MRCTLIGVEVVKMASKVSVLKDGSYVFATRYSDGSWNEPWAVGYISDIDGAIDSIASFGLTEKDGTRLSGGQPNRRWNCARLVSPEQGAAILREYPKLEGTPFNPMTLARILEDPRTEAQKNADIEQLRQKLTTVRELARVSGDDRKFVEIEADIYRVVDTLSTTNWLDYEGNFGLELECTQVRIDASEATLGELVALCENDAWDSHKSKWLHLKLAKLLAVKLGEDVAAQVMGAIASHGGLHSIDELELSPEEADVMMRSIGIASRDNE
jgi:hypothetical protein